MFESRLRAWTCALLSLVAPSECAACDAALGRDALFCDSCRPRSRFVRDNLTTDIVVYASAGYEDGVATAIHRLKYASRPDLARLLGERIADALRLAPELGEPCCLVPVPLHPKRLAERGYNQSALLAASAAGRLGWKTRPLALRRRLDTREQASLCKAERRENVRGAFEARGPLGRVPIVLVDDVVTTGATALACAEAIARAGGCVRAVASVARVGH